MFHYVAIKEIFTGLKVCSHLALEVVLEGGLTSLRKCVFPPTFFGNYQSYMDVHMAHFKEWVLTNI